MKPLSSGLLALALIGASCALLSSLGDASASDKPAAASGAGSSHASHGDKAVQAIDEFIAKQTIDKTQAGWKTKLPKPPQVAFDPAHKYTATMVTNKGTIKIRLMPDVAPMHVSSLLYLTKLGFYDGLSFHRVIPGFMAQGGCPLGTGTGGPGYKFDGEYSASVKHDRGGLLSMANAGPGTDGSQFFLTFVPTPWLDGKHTIYGEVTEGKEVLKVLEAAGSAPQGTPKEPLKIEKVTVEVM